MTVNLELTDNEEVALSTNGKWTVRYNAVTQRITFKANGLDVMSLDASGNLRLRGNVILQKQGTV